MIGQPIIDYYRCHSESLDYPIASPLKDLCGYFGFDQDMLCNGQMVGNTCPTFNRHFLDASKDVNRHEGAISLPFDPDQIVNNLRYERYVDQLGQRRWMESEWIKKTYYLLRSFFPVSLRKYFQKVYLRGWEDRKSVV